MASWPSRTTISRSARPALSKARRSRNTSLSSSSAKRIGPVLAITGRRPPATELVSRPKPSPTFGVMQGEYGARHRSVRDPAPAAGCAGGGVAYRGKYPYQCTKAHKHWRFLRATRTTTRTIFGEGYHLGD